MASIADSLAPEVLSHILKHVQDGYNHPGSPFHDRTDNIRFYNLLSMIYDNEWERDDFFGYRLVSRAWKAVSDTFVFRDLQIAIGYSPFDKRRAVSGYHNAGHRFLEKVLLGGYSPLVRNVRVEVRCNNHGLMVPVHVPVKEVSLLLSCTKSICELLDKQSCRTLCLSFESVPAPDDEPHLLTDVVAMMIMDALGELPNNCKLELSSKIPTTC